MSAPRGCRYTTLLRAAADARALEAQVLPGARAFGALPLWLRIAIDTVANPEAGSDALLILADSLRTLAHDGQLQESTRSALRTAASALADLAPSRKDPLP